MCPQVDNALVVYCHCAGQSSQFLDKISAEKLIKTNVSTKLSVEPYAKYNVSIKLAGNSEQTDFKVSFESLCKNNCERFNTIDEGFRDVNCKEMKKIHIFTKNEINEEEIEMKKFMLDRCDHLENVIQRV